MAKSNTLLNPFETAVIPLGDWVENGLDWLVDNFRPVFQAIRWPVDGVLTGIDGALNGIPPLIMLAIIGLLGWQIAGGRMGIAAVISMTIVGLIGAWSEAMTTLALVLTSVFFCILIGVPTGIWLARSDERKWPCGLFWMPCKPCRHSSIWFPSSCCLESETCRVWL